MKILEKGKRTKKILEVAFSHLFSIKTFENTIFSCELKKIHEILHSYSEGGWGVCVKNMENSFFKKTIYLLRSVKLK